MPDYQKSALLCIRITRVLLLVLAAMGAGMFGVMAALALLIWHLCTLESYGIAYLSPLVDGGQGGWM